MADYRRLFVPGGTVTLTVNLADRRARTLTDHIAHLRAAYARVRADRPFDTVAIPRPAGPPARDLVLARERRGRLYPRPPPQAPLRPRPAGRAARPPPRRTRGLPAPGLTRGQRRFWENHPRTDEALSAQIDYVHHDPVGHGHVRAMDDWPHATWRRWKAEAGRAWRPPPDGMRL